MNRFANLNPQQQQAVMASNGPVLVLAGPGSGKTRVLTQRIVYLIEELRVSPRNILAVTFTNKAASEMEKRVKDMLGERSHGVTLGTFHAICARILRREAEKHLPFKSNFVIFDQDDQINLVKQAVRDLNLDEKRYRPGGVHAAISKAKNDLILPEDFPVHTYRDEVVKRVFQRYQELLIANNALDFDDLLVWTAQLLETNPEVREKYARWYEHVLVDEFQDTNLAQYVLVKHLSSFHHNIFVVGDTDQCFPAGTMVHTPSGARPIETLQTGRPVLAASGYGTLVPAPVNHVESRPYEGELIDLLTRKGCSFRATPNHIIFARQGIDPDLKVIDLAYRKSPGYRTVVRAEDSVRGEQAPWNTPGGAFLTEASGLPAECFSLMPAGQLQPSMVVAVEQGGKITADEIVEVKRTPYQGLVYDLEIDCLHNYISGGVVVHNSIYRWRGADYRNVRRFEKDFPDTQVILLEQNYRSVQTILDVAMKVIDRHPYRIPKQLFTDRGEGEKVILHPSADDRVEAAYVVDTIASMVARGQAKTGDFAVMYRTNAQSRLLEEAFLHAGLPYKLVGAQRFYGRKEIKDVIAYLRLVHNPDDEFSLSRILGVPPRGIGEKTYQLLRQQAGRQKLSTGRLLLELAAGKLPQLKEVFPGRTGTAINNFARLLSSWRAQAQSLPPLSLMDRVMEDINFHGYVNDGTDEGLERWENVLELRRLASEFTEPGLELFLERVALVSDQDTVDTNANVPTLMTLHSAKGLEFPIVFIVGLDDGTLPHQRAIEDDEELMEERRLFYVGITRAQDRLFLVYPEHRSSYGYSEPVEPSRFLRDIPYDLLNEEGVVRRGVSARSSYRPDRWEDSSGHRTRRVTQQQYSPGMHVIHPVWGEGMVLNSRLQDDDEIVDIYFEKMGLKRVAASLAKLAVKGS